MPDSGRGSSPSWKDASRECRSCRLAVFRRSQLRAANLVVILMYAALFAMFYFVTLYLQQVLGDGALRAGLRFLPLTGAVFAGSRIAPRLVARWGIRVAVVAGLLTSMAGMLVLSNVVPGGSYAAVVLPGGVLAALGMASRSCPRRSRRSRACPPPRAGWPRAC